jgi:multidrug efflux pump subunit AcrA (membrane-fusion protein)
MALRREDRVLMARAPDRKAVFQPRLPELNDDQLPGARFTRRAVEYILLVLAVLIVVAILVMSVVSMRVTVDGVGTLEPFEVWPVHAVEPGVIVDVYVSAGDTVQEGEVLAQLDPLDLEGQLVQLELRYRVGSLASAQTQAAAPLETRRQRAHLSQAEAALVQARALLRQQLVEFGIPGSVDSVLSSYSAGHHTGLDLAVADVLSAQAQYEAQIASSELLGFSRFDTERDQAELERVRADIDLVRERLGRLTIRSPTAGIILTEHLERLVRSHLPTGGLVLEVANAQSWRAVLLVDGRDVHRIQLGDPVRVEVDALRHTISEALQAHVTFIAPQPIGGDQTNARTAPPLYRVEAALDDVSQIAATADVFRRGYSARGKIVTRSGRILQILLLKVTETLHINS